MNEEATALLTVENAMEQSASIFEGHPAEIEPDESIEKDEKSGEKLDEKPEIKPDEKLDEKPELEKKPAFEYVSQEAAEKGVKETKTLMHKKAEEAKRERERAEDLQKQLNDSPPTWPLLLLYIRGISKNRYRLKILYVIVSFLKGRE